MSVLTGFVNNCHLWQRPSNKVPFSDLISSLCYLPDVILLLKNPLSTQLGYVIIYTISRIKKILIIRVPSSVGKILIGFVTGLREIIHFKIWI